jgi:hypothetical protein
MFSHGRSYPGNGHYLSRRRVEFHSDILALREAVQHALQWEFASVQAEFDLAYQGGTKSMVIRYNDIGATVGTWQAFGPSDLSASRV